MAHRVGERLLLDGLLAGREVAVSRNAPDFTRPGACWALPLADPFLSRKPLVFSQGPRRRRAADAAGDGTQVRAGGRAAAGRLGVLARGAGGGRAAGAGRARGGAAAPGGPRGERRPRTRWAWWAAARASAACASTSSAWRTWTCRCSSAARRARARSWSPGPSTSGARGASGPFVSVNLGAIPKELAAAELFGAHAGRLHGRHEGPRGLLPRRARRHALPGRGGRGAARGAGHAAARAGDGRDLPGGRAHAREGGRAADRRHGRAPGGADPARGASRRRCCTGWRATRSACPRCASAARTSGRCSSTSPAQELEAHRARRGGWSPTDSSRRAVAAGAAGRRGWCATRGPGNIRQLRNLTRQLVIGSRGQPAAARWIPGWSRSWTPPWRLGPAAPPPARAAVSAEPKAAERAQGPRPPQGLGGDRAGAARGPARERVGPKAAADRLGIPRSSIYDLIDKSPNIRTAGDLSVGGDHPLLPGVRGRPGRHGAAAGGLQAGAGPPHQGAGPGVRRDLIHRTGTCVSRPSSRVCQPPVEVCQPSVDVSGRSSDVSEPDALRVSATDRRDRAGKTAGFSGL